MRGASPDSGRARCVGLGQRDAQGERRAEAFLAPHGDRAAVVAGHVLDDGQPEAGAAGAAGPRLVDPVEALEDAGAVLARDADAAVGDGDLGEPGPGAGGDGDPVGARAVGDGVGQQVGDGGGQLALHARARRGPPARRRRSPAPWPAPPSGCGRRPRPAPCRCPPARARAAARRPACGTGRSARARAGPAGRPRASMRPAKRWTASGSSAAPSMASASRASAPTGVFSSCPTLATKSRRTASTRRASVTSCSTRATGPGGGSVPLCSRTPCTPDQAGAGAGQVAGQADVGPPAAAGAHLLHQAEQLRHHQPAAAHDAQRAGGRVGQQHRVVGVDEDHGRVHEVQQPAGQGRLGQGEDLGARTGTRRDRCGSGE